MYSSLIENKDKPAPSAVQSFQPSVQAPVALLQKTVQAGDVEPPRADGSDKYYGMENVPALRA